MSVVRLLDYTTRLAIEKARNEHRHIFSRLPCEGVQIRCVLCLLGADELDLNGRCDGGRDVMRKEGA
jgi:hypothetical protein